MSHSYTCLLCHFAFSMEGRLPLIPPRATPAHRRCTVWILQNHRTDLGA